MANRAEKTAGPFEVAPGVTARIFGGGAYHLKGTRDALIASGLADEGDFAVLPKRNHYVDFPGGSKHTRRGKCGVYFLGVCMQDPDSMDEPTHDPGRTAGSWATFFRELGAVSPAAFRIIAEASRQAFAVADRRRRA